MKQVIIIRKDLKMRQGKAIAQACHGSSLITYELVNSYKLQDRIDLTLWLNSNYKKVCVYVNSEKELLDLAEQASKAFLHFTLVVDNGLTEFHGQKTTTCLVIGPNKSEDIDKITGHLKLL